MSHYTEGQVHQLVNALENAGWTAEDLTRLGQHPNLGRLPQQFFFGNEHAVIDDETSVAVEPADLTICLSRTIEQVYPAWGVLVDPKLEEGGPSKYNLKTDLQELSFPQWETVTRGHAVYDSFCESGEIARQLGLADLLAIQAKGVPTFRWLCKLFKGRSLFGLKSTMRKVKEGNPKITSLHSPYLYLQKGEVALGWCWLGNELVCFSDILLSFNK